MGEAQKERKAINEQEKQSGGNRYAKSTNGITYGGLRKNETGGTELPALYTSHCANIGGKRGGGPHQQGGAHGCDSNNYSRSVVATKGQVAARPLGASQTSAKNAL